LRQAEFPNSSAQCIAGESGKDAESFFDMDPDLRERIRKLTEEVLSQHPDASISDLNRLLSDRTRNYNTAPQPEMAGLSPQQAHRLLYGGWEGPNAGMLVNRDLGLDDLRGSSMPANARLLLASIRDQGGVKATVNGNLNRAFVIDITQAMFIEPLWTADIGQLRKSLREEEVPELNVLRHVLQIAGLLRKTKGRFHVTRKGAALTADEKAGELFALLFETMFRRLNLAVLTRSLPEFPLLQNMIAFSFYAFFILGCDWRIVDDIYEQLVLPAVRQRIDPGKYGNPLRYMVRGWILRPLEWLGLAQIEESCWVAGHLEQPARVRKMPLFDRFLEFQLGPTGP
jgi:hypothetical protein